MVKWCDVSMLHLHLSTLSIQLNDNGICLAASVMDVDYVAFVVY